MIDKIVNLFTKTSLISIAFGLCIFLLAFVLSTFLVWLIRKYAVPLRLIDQPGERKIHDNPMPVGGGIAIFTASFSAIVIGFIVMLSLRKSFAGLWRHLNIPDTFAVDIAFILGGGVCIFITGLIDDYRGLQPWTKLAVEIGVGTALFFHDIRLTFFIHNHFFSFCITVFWIVLITNSFNLLDNMDGLSCGVAFLAGTTLLWVAVTLQEWGVAFLLLGLLGALLGFWRYNFPPASIFMGDSGSLFIGYMLSVISIYATFYQSHLTFFPVVLPLLIFAIPLFDTATVVMYRWQDRRPIFQGDKNHFSHRLVSLGMSTKSAVLTIYLVTIATGINATLLYQVNWFGAIVVVVQLFCMLLFIHLLEVAARNRG